MEPVEIVFGAGGIGVSADIDPRSALRRVTGWEVDGVTVKALSAGHSNRSYKVNRGNESFVLRLDAAHTPAFGLDRSRELRIVETAAKAGLAPDIVFADRDAGVLITRFIAGRVWTSDDLCARESMEFATAMLREVHALPLSNSCFDGYAIAQGYISRMSESLRVNGLIGFAERCADIIVATAKPGTLCCCHNDVVAENMIGLPRPMLIDWEYACDNDPLFDLASLLAYHDVGKELSRAWLDAYSGSAAPEHRERLQHLRRLYNALHWLWLALRQSISPGGEQKRRLENLQRVIERRASGQVS